jgi:hypothetical protein
MEILFKQKIFGRKYEVCQIKYITMQFSFFACKIREKLTEHSVCDQNEAFYSTENVLET